MDPRCPDVTVQLSGENGNAFAVIGRVQRALVRHGYDREAQTFTSDAYATEGYDELLQTCMRWVDVR